MFTGIIEETGTVTDISSNKITINCSTVLEDCKVGDSIAVNGVCLTVSKLTKTGFIADISPETYNVTALGDLRTNTYVNLERALTPTSRMGGHIVTGHVDTIGQISNIQKVNDFYEIKIKYDKPNEKYIVKKGSICINGISLTIADSKDNCITIAVIPHTYNTTVLKYLNTGENVNIEFDILAKYVEKFLLSRDNSNITVNFLAENGFC